MAALSEKEIALRLLFAAFLSSVKAISNCPASCTCHSIGFLVETVTVDCHGRDLSVIPSTLPARTTHL